MELQRNDTGGIRRSGIRISFRDSAREGALADLPRRNR